VGSSDSSPLRIITNILLVVVPVLLMCVLSAAYSKELCLLPLIAVLAFPGSDQIAVGFAAFVIIALFKLVNSLIFRREV
jgi:hypothetical protein